MGKFTKGHKLSKGRPKGSKNEATILFQDILESRKAELLNKAIEMALNGNATIMNKLLDKMLPNIQPMILDPDGNLIPEIIINVRNNAAST